MRNPAFINSKMRASEHRIKRIHNRLAADSISKLKRREVVNLNPIKIVENKYGTCWSF